MKCAAELGMPTDQMLGNVMGKLGLTPDQLAELLKKILPLETKTEVTNETEQA